MRRPLSIAALAILIRVLVVGIVAGDQQRVFNSDSYEFHRLARGLLERGVFSRSRLPPYAPEVEITPLYPLAVAGVYALTGPHYLAALILDILIAGVVAAALVRAGGAFGSMPGLLYALDPTSIVYTAMFGAETAFAALLLAALALLARGLAPAYLDHWRGWVAAAGVVAGLAVLVKPVAMYLPLLLLPSVVLVRRRRVGAASVAVVFAVTWAAVVTPWLLRNRAAVGIATISSVQEINLLYWNVGVLEASRRGIDRGAAASALREELATRAGRRFAELTVAEQLGGARALAIDKIAAAPGRYGALHVRGALLTLIDPGRRDIGRLLGGLDWGFSLLDAMTRGGLRGAVRAARARPCSVLGVMAMVMLWLAGLYVAALAGLWRTRSRIRDRPLSLLLLVASVYLLAIGGPIGNARFRVPIVPSIVWFAAIGLRPTRAEDPCESSA